jgi:hypothetical protein
LMTGSAATATCVPLLILNTGRFDSDLLSINILAF